MSTAGDAMAVVPAPHVAFTAGSKMLSHPERGPLHTFRNGYRARRDGCSDRIQQVADERVKLRVLGSHSPGSEP